MTMKAKKSNKKSQEKDLITGKLRIGDNWNAITIIALSQNNPLKAIAEFVENSIDARSKNINIIRGKQKGEHYLKIIDDGEGIDDLKYVATHIGDSIKRQLKKKGIEGLQGEFGIGLLSFWTVGDELVLTSAGKEGKTSRMKLLKNNPGYSISPVGNLFDQKGTELLIKPILSGVRQINGEKIQNYLASELRDRISKSGVKIKIIDRTARKEFVVKPRKFQGRLLHNLPETKNPIGEIYYELYISDPKPENIVGLYKLGTRVLPEITSIDFFNSSPWTSDYLEGIVDVSFLHLTPGTRDGIIYDDVYESFCKSMEEMTDHLSGIIEEQQKAEEEKASKNILHKVRKALKEAFLMLPREEYDWLDIYAKGHGSAASSNKIQNKGIVAESSNGHIQIETGAGLVERDVHDTEIIEQKEFFEYPGPLFKIIISPSSVIVGVNEKKNLRLIARDKNRRQIDSNIDITWQINEGNGMLSNTDSEIVEFTAPDEPGLTLIEVKVEQDEMTCNAECIMTITDQIIPKKNSEFLSEKKGLPGYTFKKASGELWRSRFDNERHLVIINNGHADFIYASKVKKRKLKYIMRLFSKELIIKNFPGMSKEELLERLIELTLYTEDNLN